MHTGRGASKRAATCGAGGIVAVKIGVRLALLRVAGAPSAAALALLQARARKRIFFSARVTINARNAVSCVALQTNLHDILGPRRLCTRRARRACCRMQCYWSRDLVHVHHDWTTGGPIDYTTENGLDYDRADGNQFNFLMYMYNSLVAIAEAKCCSLRGNGDCWDEIGSLSFQLESQSSIPVVLCVPRR